MNKNAEQRVKAMEKSLHGFSLKSVCWGYRDKFAQIIEGLLEQGAIGEHKPETKRYFFDFLKQADEHPYDHVLKEFISSINPQTRWILDLPSLFSEIISLGREFAEVRLHHGITYFQKWGEGAFGDNPEEVWQQLRRLRNLRQIDEELAVAFLSGYSVLRDRLRGPEVELYLQHGRQLYQSSPAAALEFMRVKTARSENIIRGLTQECQLEDISKELSSLLRSLVGYEIEIDHLGQLDSDDLMERGSNVVCLYKWLYLPITVRHFDQCRKNRHWYILAAVAAAGMLSENSFPRIHGHPEYRTCADLVGSSTANLNLLQIIEYVRVLNKIRNQWPGIIEVLEKYLQEEFRIRHCASQAEELLRECLTSTAKTPAAEIIRKSAGKSVNIFDTASLMESEETAAMKRNFPGIGLRELYPLSFLPDFLFPGELSQPPPTKLIADLRQAAPRPAEEAAENEKQMSRLAQADESSQSDQAEQNEAGEEKLQACFIYDEWAHKENSYYKDHCQLYEQYPAPRTQASIPTDNSEEVRRVRRVFERFKPELAKKQKGLREGDEINHDRLIEFWIAKKRNASPRVDFYEKPLTSYRDLAVLVLLDASGSTGEGADRNRRIIEIENRAAGYLQAEFDLFVNDEKIDRSRIGETVYQVNKRRVEYEYVGIPLRPGENQLRIRTRSPDQEEDRETEIMVRRSTAPVTLRMEVSPEFPTGDGRTEPEVEVRFLDEAGVPTACGSVFTVLVDQGEILTRDLRPGEAGHQVRVRDGIAQFRLSAADQAETREILILAGDLEQRQTLRFSPDLRDWIINGVVSLTGQREKRKEKEDRRDAQVRRRFGLEDRLAFFAKGRLPFDVLMTTAYDTDKRGEEGRIFQERDPLEYYPLYGDESERKYEAESRDKLFLKLEREDSHVMWGDFQTGLDQTRLSAYDRGLTGAGTVYKSAWFSGRGFFSRNDQAQVKAELRGRGVSGYYELTDQNLIENSEQVILETRDRWHPERVLETSPKRRYADYDIDYERGRILFKRPVPSLDRNLNPVYIVVNYEVDGRRAKDYNVYGARAAVHDPEHRFELGVTRIVEEAMPRDYTLDGIDATFNILPELVFKAEYAESDTVEEERDQAHLAELISEYDRARFRAWYEDTGEEFTNLSMRGGTAGLETFGLEGEFQAADNLRFRDHLYTRRNTAANTASDVLLHDNIHTVNGFDLLLGGGYVSETENREEAESEKRRSGIMRTGAGFELGTRWRLEALHHHAFEDTTFEQPTRTGGDVSYKIDSLTRAYLGGERRDSMAGGSEHNLALGLERQFNRYLNGFQEMRLEGVADGRRLASGSGLDLRWPMTPEITFDASGELSRALDTSSDTEFGLDKNDFQALALGVSYRPFQGQYTASSRYEVRDSDDQTGHLAEVGGTVKLNPDHSLFGRNIFTYTRERDPELDDGWSLDLRTGWAYRPAANDRLMALSDVEVKTENRGGAAAGRRSRRYMFSGELHYQVVAHTWLEAKYGARLVQADFANTSLFSDVKALRMQYDFNDSFYGAGGLRMLKVYEGPSHELSYGLELGYNLRADTRLAAGYNFRGFEDRDFARNDNWQRGFFIALHWKFDESILGVFRRLEKD